MTETDPTPLERAARAMYDTVQPEWDWNDPDAEPLRTMYRQNARAAFTALMEPCPTMIGPHPEGAARRAVWQEMVAAILNAG